MLQSIAKQTAIDSFMLGRLYYRVGAIFAIEKKIIARPPIGTTKQFRWSVNHCQMLHLVILHDMVKR